MILALLIFKFFQNDFSIFGWLLHDKYIKFQSRKIIKQIFSQSCTARGPFEWWENYYTWSITVIHQRPGSLKSYRIIFLEVLTCPSLLILLCVNFFNMQCSWVIGIYLKGHRHDWGQCLFTKLIWHEILIEFLQKVIQKCTNHFGKDWAINRAEITHKSLYL